MCFFLGEGGGEGERTRASKLITSRLSFSYMAWLGSAWCPGGRTNANPFFTSPLITLSASSITEPAA